MLQHTAPPRFRWVVCGLLFLATTINYMDRQIFGILAPVLEKEIGWTQAQYGLMITAFQAAYAVGMPVFGRLIDTIGTRAGYALAIGWWSLAAMAHGAARSPFGFSAARAALGFGEAGNFPAAVKSISEWFPQKECALAIGLFNCGSNVGAIITPLVVPWIVLRYGWQWAFYSVGAVGLLWLVLWLAINRKPPLTPSASEPPVSWTSLLNCRATWAIMVARFLTDPVWWFYLYWTPKFLHEKHGLSIGEIGAPLVVIYLSADVGSVFGGWLSSQLLRRGWSANAARKTAILVAACLVAPMALAPRVDSVWGVVTILSLATAGHQAWAANMFSILADLYPPRATSTITGITGLSASLGGMLAATALGFALQATGSYTPAFLYASCSYFLILAILHAAIPRFEPIKL